MIEADIYNEKELLKENPLKKWGKFIKLDGFETFIVEMGQGENIIFANGIAASVYTWRKVLPKLGEKYHVYGFDFKGTGFSEKPEIEYSIDVFSKQVLELMDYFKMEKAILVGNSLGGEVVMDFTIKYSQRVKALVLMDTAGYQNNKEITGLLSKLSRYKPVAKFLKKIASKKLARKIIDWATYNETIIDKEMVDGYYKPMKTEGAFESLIKLVRNLSYTEFDYNKVKEIKVPTLIIWGTEDKWMPVSDAHRFHKDIKNSKLVLMTSCGHAPQEETPEKVIDEITKFIDEDIK